MDAQELGWDMIIDTDSDRTIEATVSADLAVTVMLEGTEPPQLQALPVATGLPELPVQNINMYVGDEDHPPSARLADLVRQGYDALQLAPLRAVG